MLSEFVREMLKALLFLLSQGVVSLLGVLCFRSSGWICGAVRAHWLCVVASCLLLSVTIVLLGSQKKSRAQRGRRRRYEFQPNSTPDSVQVVAQEPLDQATVAEMRQQATQLVALSVASFYGVAFCFRLLLLWLSRPLVPFWKVSSRDRPPALDDPALGEHAYATLKSVKLHYVENGDKSKPLMLFLHGFPEFWYSWRSQLKEFSKDFWVVAVDMRGYGDSDKPKGVDNYKLPLLVEDVKQLVEALGRHKFTLVAHDWGGLVAWAFVYKYPEMLHNYVIIDAAQPDVFPHYIMSNWTQFLKSWYIFFFQLPYLPELSLKMYDFAMFDRMYRKYNKSMTKEEIDAYKYTYGREGALTPPINYYRAYMDNFWDGPTLAKGKVLPPGLFIFGEHEDYILMETLDYAKDHVPNVVTAVVENAGHFAQQDNPKEVNKLIRMLVMNTNY